MQRTKPEHYTLSELIVIYLTEIEEKPPALRPAPFLLDPSILTFPAGASLSLFHRRRSRNSLLEGQPEATAPDAPGDERGVLVDVVQPPGSEARLEAIARTPHRSSATAHLFQDS